MTRMDIASKKLYSHKIKTAVEVEAAIGRRPRNLLYAKTKADILVASLTADEHIKKGNMRPYVPQDLRAINLAALEMVDYVVVDTDPTPIRNLGIIKPDYFAKGYEYTAGVVHPKTQEEMKTLESYGGEMIFTPGDIVYSSSALIELAPPSIAIEKLINLMQSEGVSFGDLRKAIVGMKGVKVHVVGDTIVDSYTYCSRHCG